jgi:hypothetical protein
MGSKLVMCTTGSTPLYCASNRNDPLTGLMFYFCLPFIASLSDFCCSCLFIFHSIVTEQLLCTRYCARCLEFRDNKWYIVWMFVSSQNSQVAILTPKVMVLGGDWFMRVEPLWVGLREMFSITWEYSEKTNIYGWESELSLTLDLLVP